MKLYKNHTVLPYFDNDMLSLIFTKLRTCGLPKRKGPSPGFHAGAD